jgi:hypothetical protein
MSFTERFSEVNRVFGGLNADQRAAGNYNTAWSDVSEHHRAAILLNVGPMAAGATLDLIVQEAQDNAGTGVQAIAGKAITQLTQAGGDQNDFVIIEVRMEELTPGYGFIRAQLTVAVDAVDLGVWVLGTIPRYPPVPLTLVTEVVD